MSAVAFMALGIGSAALGFALAHNNDVIVRKIVVQQESIEFQKTTLKNYGQRLARLEQRLEYSENLSRD